MVPHHAPGPAVLVLTGLLGPMLPALVLDHLEAGGPELVSQPGQPHHQVSPVSASTASSWVDSWTKPRRASLSRSRLVGSSSSTSVGSSLTGDSHPDVLHDLVR